MVTVILKTGKTTNYSEADEVKTDEKEYLIIQNGNVVGQIPRENVEQIMFSLPQIAPKVS